VADRNACHRRPQSRGAGTPQFARRRGQAAEEGLAAHRDGGDDLMLALARKLDSNRPSVAGAPASPPKRICGEEPRPLPPPASTACSGAATLGLRNLERRRRGTSCYRRSAMSTGRRASTNPTPGSGGDRSGRWPPVTVLDDLLAE